MLRLCVRAKFILTSDQVNVEHSMLPTVFFRAIFSWLQAISQWLFGKSIFPSAHAATPNLAYRGLRPNLPTAVAVIWAEEMMDDAAIKQLANIMQWCDHGALETFCLYDPSGALKLNVQQLKCELLDQKWVVQVGWRHEPLDQELLCKTCRAAQGHAMAVCSAAIGVHALNPRAEPVQLLQSPAVSSVLAAAIKVDPAEKQVKVAAPTSSCSQLHPSAATVGDGCVIGLKPSSCSVAGCGTLPHGCNPGAGSSGMAEATATASSPECEAGSAAPCISFAYGLGGGCCREGCEKALGKSGVRVAARWEHPFAVAKAEGPSKCGTDAVKSEDCDKGECSRLRLDTAANAVAKDPGMQRQGAGTEAIGVVHGCLQDCSGPHKESDQIGDARNDPRITSGTDGQPPGCPAQSSSLANRPCGRRAQAHLLSAEDGYAPVLSVARTGGVCSCCGAVILLKSGPYREGLSRLRSQMAELAGPAVLVQPELVLVVGPVLTLAGFPPLQVAASEILHLGPSRGLNRARVDAALAKFLRTEQRFGS